MPHATPALIAVDWGTTAFRAYLADAGGGVLARLETPDGILAVGAGDFAAVLARVVAPWRAAHGALPILMSGMIGSRQGWVEAPYVRCPAGLDDLAGNLVRIEAAGLGAVHIVAGLDARDGAGQPDVMRGEETQILGALEQGRAVRGCFALPGTHSKWVRVEAGAIVGFATYMTGEVFAALKGHTILGRLMNDVTGGGTGFLAGVEAGRSRGNPGRLLHRLFSARTLGLTGMLPADELSDYLSGLLIGAEIADAATPAETFTIIASDALAERYGRAARHLGFICERAASDCVVAGAAAVARRALLIGDDA